MASENTAEPKARKPRADADRNRQRLLAAATDAFAEGAPTLA